MFRINPLSSCRKYLKKTGDSPGSIYSLMLFLVYNMHCLQTNSSLQDIYTGYKNQLHISLVRIPDFFSYIYIYKMVLCLPPPTPFCIATAHQVSNQFHSTHYDCFVALPRFWVVG
jgi:hypothetical protein